MDADDEHDAGNYEGEGEEWDVGEGEDEHDIYSTPPRQEKKEDIWMQNRLPLTTMHIVGEIVGVSNTKDHIYKVNYNLEHIAKAQPWILKFPFSPHCMAVYVERTNGKEEKEPLKNGWSKGYCFRILNRIPSSFAIQSFTGAQILFSSAQRECYETNPERIPGFKYDLTREEDTALIHSSRGMPVPQSNDQHKAFVRYMVDLCRPSVANVFRDGPFQFVIQPKST